MEKIVRYTIELNILFISFIFFNTHTGCSALKLISVNVPTMVVMGQPVWLNCSYDLENEELYSIKWYHWNADSEAKGEFYRWIPKDSPPGQMFQMEGIYLDVSLKMNFFPLSKYFTIFDLDSD